MTLTAHTIYRHEEHGTVLVLGVHHIFETYDPDSADGRLQSRVVRYSTEWDEYGPMPSSVRTTPVDAFATAISEAVRAWEETECAQTDDT